jgi:hypothetical protein
MKKIFNGLLFVLSFIWQLPQSIVGLIMLIFFKIFGGAQLISYKKLCFAYKAKNMSGGISLGNFAFLSEHLAKDEPSIAHEQLGHTVQSKILGPLYLLIVGLPSLLHASVHDYRLSCYYDYWCEHWANECAGLTTTQYCRLVFKDREQ